MLVTARAPLCQPGVPLTPVPMQRMLLQARFLIYQYVRGMDEHIPATTEWEKRHRKSACLGSRLDPLQLAEVAMHLSLLFRCAPQDSTASRTRDAAMFVKIPRQPVSYSAQGAVTVALHVDNGIAVPDRHLPTPTYPLTISGWLYFSNPILHGLSHSSGILSGRILTKRGYRSAPDGITALALTSITCPTSSFISSACPDMGATPTSLPSAHP